MAKYKISAPIGAWKCNFWLSRKPFVKAFSSLTTPAIILKHSVYYFTSQWTNFRQAIQTGISQCITKLVVRHFAISRWGMGAWNKLPDHARTPNSQHAHIYLSDTHWQQLQGVQEKLCFFPIHCNPSLAYIAVRDLQSSQRNASVQSLLLLAGIFLCNQ